MSHKSQPPCPECEKLTKVSEESNKIGNFLDWMYSRGLVLCTWEENDDEDTNDYLPDILVPASKYRTHSGIENLLAEYFGVDLDKVEKERRALLDWLREVQGGNE